MSPIDPIFFTVAWALTQRPIFFHLICHSMPHDLKSWHLKKILCILYCTTQGTNIPTTPASDRIPGSTRTMLCFKYHPKTLLYCELLALTRWPHIFLYFSLTEYQKSCSHPMTPHFLSLCSHRMPQPVGGRPYTRIHFIFDCPPPGKGDCNHPLG